MLSPRTMALLFAAAMALGAGSLAAERIECGTNRRMEVVSYKWDLDGFLSWIAGLRFPTHGTGSLATVVRANGSIATELRIVSHEEDNDLYQYQSEIDPRSLLTLTSLDGYKFEGRQRSATTSFDYTAKTMRREKADSKKDGPPRSKVEPIPSGEIRDVLSVIYYLRKNAAQLAGPTKTRVYSAGKLYDVMLIPGSESLVEFGGTRVKARQYTISATPEHRKKWPGDVSFWLSLDERAIPVRILIRQRGASLKLTAEAAFSCP